MTAPGEKWCRDCRTVKDVAQFGPHRLTSDGRQSYCKACFARRYRARREAEGKQSRPAEIPEGHKYCRTCRRVLPWSDWDRRKNAVDGYHSRCRSCATIANRADHLARTYGMTLEEVEAMRVAQAGLCAICITAPAVHVDHDHVTGEVRGMLCFSCNAALGHFRDEPVVLRRAADYLETRAGSAMLPCAPSDRDEHAWAAVLGRIVSHSPSRMQATFRTRLADAASDPTC